jgi:hypothetical protein
VNLGVNLQVATIKAGTSRMFPNSDSPSLVDT